MAAAPLRVYLSSRHCDNKFRRRTEGEVHKGQPLGALEYIEIIYVYKERDLYPQGASNVCFSADHIDPSPVVCIKYRFAAGASVFSFLPRGIEKKTEPIQLTP